MALAADTKPIPVGGVRRRHRGRIALVAILIVVVLLAVAAVVGDRVFRAYAEGQIEQHVEQTLPAGVSGTVHARIGGFSALWQYAHGHFDDVHIASSDLRIRGQDATASIDATDLPVSGDAPLPEVAGTLHLGQGLIRTVAPRTAGVGPLTLGDGVVSTTVVRKILNVPITVLLTLTPSVRGGTVHLAPTKAQLKAGPISVPGTALIQALLPDGVSVCAAKYLPPTLHLTSVVAHPGSATVTFAGKDLDLATIGTKTGSCS